MQEAPVKRRSPGRWLRFLAGALLAAALAIFGLLRTLDAFGIEVPGPTRLWPAHAMLERVPKIAAAAGRRGTYQVAFFGDSTVVGYPFDEWVTTRLQEILRHTKGRFGDPAFRIHNLALPGMSAFDFYFLADAVARAHPDLAVLPFNPASMGAPWRAEFSRPELAGWIPPSDLGEALGLPLHWIGLTTDRLFLYMGIVQAGGFPAWLEIGRQQSRLAPAWRGLESASDGRMERYRQQRQNAELLRRTYPKRKRYRAGFLERHYGPCLRGTDASHPVLRMLAATLRIFNDAGVPVLVYTVPLNVEHMLAEGIVGDGGLGRTLHAVEELVRANGADYLDLHRLLPDAGFRDPPGHFAIRRKEGFDGTGQVALVLANRVRALARTRPRVPASLPVPAP